MKVDSKYSKNVDIIGLESVQSILETLIPREANNLSKAMVFGFAQHAAKGFKLGVNSQTGNLKRAIRASRGRSFPGKPIAFVKVSRGKKSKADGFYWRFVEHGTGGKNPQSARPFVAPVLNRMNAEMPKLVDEIFTQKLAGAVKRAQKRISKRG